jgi:hypothetical protein
VNHYNINGKKQLFSKKNISNFDLRLKDNVSISDTISSQDRIRTFSDGVLNINNIEPSDHGSYACIISILNSTSIRSKPAIITVKCEFIIFIFIVNIKKK